MKKRRISLYLVPLSLILPALAAAQANPLFSMRGPTITIAGSPFQGKRLGHFVQQLADGTTVTQEVRGQIARDSDGRVRVEEQRGDQPDSVEVLDPISQTALRWTSASTEATRSTPLSRFPSHVTFPSQSSLAAREVNLQESEPGKVTTESLGDKTINGLVTTGKRTSTVVSTGKIVHDVWFSEDLKLAILDTFTDTNGTQQTIEIEDVTRTEPDPALFHLPKGYTERHLALPGQIGAGRAPVPADGCMPDQPKSAPAASIQVDSAAQAQRLISHILPVYPRLAQQVGVQGTVVLQALIDSDGKVAEVHVVSGHPLLVHEAIVAVCQWRYTPTIVNGSPIEVDTTVTVPFALGGEKP